MSMEKEIGSLEIGKRTHLIRLDYRALGLQPVLDPVQNHAYHAHAGNVERGMVDGTIRVEGHEVTSVDRLAVIDAAMRRLPRARQRKRAERPLPPRDRL
jgi:cytosine/adenosine deaminase-related metal-dependent hydrolase